MDIKTTDELCHEIKAVTDVEDFLKNNERQLLRQSLSEHLNVLLAQKGISRADVVRGSQLDRAYVYQIFSGDKVPSRDKLIALAFGLCLSVNETQRMLKLSGNRELYPRDKRDSLIMFTLQQNGDISGANALLYKHKLDTLGIETKNS